MHPTDLDSLPTPIQDSLYRQKPMTLTRKRRRNCSTMRRERSCTSKWLSSFKNCSSSTNPSMPPNHPQFLPVYMWLFRSLFFRYVLVSPKERKVVIVESALCPTEIRETLAKVLFRHFEVTKKQFSLADFNFY